MNYTPHIMDIPRGRLHVVEQKDDQVMLEGEYFLSFGSGIRFRLTHKGFIGPEYDGRMIVEINVLEHKPPVQTTEFMGTRFEPGSARIEGKLLDELPAEFEPVSWDEFLKGMNSPMKEDQTDGKGTIYTQIARLNREIDEEATRD